jgi:radical SAM superfamily enzyme YgiQ (UPF0313 family)
LAAAGARRTVRVYFIKPSRYDDDGEVLRYRWGMIPNNTLTVLAGISASDAGARGDVEIQTVLWDEMVDGTLSASAIEALRERARADRVELLVGLAGVQTNQYPRARDLALQFRRGEVPVLMGGFHVSSHPPSCAFLVSAGVTVVLGEAEGVWPALMDDYLRGALRPCYRRSEGLRAKTGRGEILVPSLAEAALPGISPRYLGRFFNPTFSTLDTSRGCPFVCSYCSVKNVMGRTMRSRDPGRVIEWMREAHDEHGVRNLLIVDDDFFRSPHWEPILLGMGELRRSGRAISFIMQTDVAASLDDDRARTPGPVGSLRGRGSRRFVELAAEAGCFEVFVGLESFDPGNLARTLKLQNQEPQDRRGPGGDRKAAAARVKARYRRAVEGWHRAGIGVHAGYIIGLPFDDVGCGQRAARDLAEIGVDLASFFVFTPLPGTEDHVDFEAAGRLRSHDFNDYDSTHVVAAHPLLSAEQLGHEYRSAYRSFYSWRRLAWSLATLHGVPRLTRESRLGMLTQQLYFTYSDRTGRHPMMGGIGRLSDGASRREAVTDEEARLRYLGVSS